MDTGHHSRYRLYAWLLIAGAAVARLGYLAWFCPFDLAPDEAHYWEWSRRLDWAYYSKGPLVAILIRLSNELLGPISIALTGNEALAVRTPAVLCGSLLLMGLFQLTRLAYADDRLGFLVVAAALTHPLLTAGSMLMTIDSPFLCAWTWALVFVWRAIFGGTGWAWPAAGLCVALGLLAKPTMVLWPAAFVLFLVATPSLRGRLREAGVWILLAVAFAGAIPSIVWNLQNDWVTLRHTGTHAGFGDVPILSWIGPVKFLGTQFVLMLGLWFVVWVLAAWRYRPRRASETGLGLLWWMSIPIVAFFAVFSLKNGGGEPNWPVAGYISGSVLAAGWLRDALKSLSDRSRRMWTSGVIGVSLVGLLATLAMHAPIQTQPILLRIAGPATSKHPMPIRRIDPTARLRGWRRLGAEVDRVRATLPGAVLAGERWTIASEVAFYAGGHPEVFCIGLAVGDRHSQYDLWRPNPIADADVFRGQSFILVNVESTKVEGAFDRLDPVRRVEYRENEALIASWTIQVAHGFRRFAKKSNRAY